MKNDRRRTILKVIHSLDDIPIFASEHEEQVWWGEHELSDELWRTLPKVEHGHGKLNLTKRPPRAEVQSWDDVPLFRSEEEERAWWEDRIPSEELLDSLPERPILRTRLETLREFVRIGRASRR